MDKARPFEFVHRLPADTIEELGYRELVYDHQVLLNESWSTCAKRTGRTHRVNENRVKQITETWKEYESRKANQCHVLENEAINAEKESVKRLQKVKEDEDASKNTIAHIMSVQECIASQHTQCRHSLFVDYDRLQQRKFTGEHNIIMAAEDALRFVHIEYENELFESIKAYGCFHHFLAVTATRKRLQEEEEERQRIAEEKQRAIEEMKLEEERRQKELEEAERARKEAMEQERILQRRRREEERRAKARMDREKQKKQHSTISTQENTHSEDAPRDSSVVEVKTANESTSNDESSA